MRQEHSATNLRHAIFSILLTGSLIQATPSSYDLFQGSAYSGGGHKQRNKNWCARVVYKNVTCAVLGSAESFLEPEVAPCPPHQPDCAQRMMYRTQFRPTYRIAYKQVTELEWRCCPEFQGPDCKELKGTPSRQPVQRSRPQFQPQPIPGQAHHTLRPGLREAEPLDRGQSGGGERVRRLEGEVNRLSQTVLDLQAAMTGMNEILRLDIQEDTSKMLLTLLNTLHLPDSALTGPTEAVGLPGQEEVMSRLDLVTNTLKTKSDLLDQLQGTLDGHEGQLRLLMQAAQGHALPDTGHAHQPQDHASSSKGTPTSPQDHTHSVQGHPPSPEGHSPNSLDPLQKYIDGKFRDLRDELLESMELKMASLKSSCDYDILSLRKQCEEQGSSYLSLAELLDNKEAGLRKEIRDLRLDLGTSDGVVRTNRGAGVSEEDNDLRREVQRVAEAHRVLNARVDNELEHLSSVRFEDWFGDRLEELEDRMNVTERNAEAHCFYVEDKLSKQIADEASELRRLLDERLNNMEDQFTTMLVEISNNSLPAAQTGGLEALGHVVNANRYQLQGLEEKLNALGKQCSTDCGAGPRGFDEVLKDVRQYRSDLDTVHADLSVNADRLQDLEAQLQTQQLNGQSLASLQADVASLGGSVRALERYVSNLGESQRDQERELQILNATCCQDCEQEGADAQPGQPGQPVQPGHPAQAPAVNSSQVEELRGRLEELSREVRAELARRREGVPRPEDSGSKPGDVTDSLRRVADTLNRHVSNVWARVQQLHATQRAQTRDMNGLKASMQSLQAQLTEMADTRKVPVSSPGQPVVRGGGNENLSPPTETKPPPHVPVAPRPGGSLVPHIRIPLIIPHRTPPATVPRIPSPPLSPSSPFSPSIPRQPNALPLPSTPRRPVMETGEAGPPGSEPRIRVSLTQAVSDTRPLQGFAGAPGYPPLNPVSFKPRVVPAAFVPSSRADRPIATPVSAGGSVVSEPFSFSAGLTAMPFPWHMGIIRFNKVLVNDGGHYSPRTGIFTVPQDGRYLVSAVLTAQRGDRVEGALSVNDRSVQRLSSMGHGSHAPVTARHQVQEPCSCGGSTSINLILHLHRGDRVGVVMTAGKLATSEPKEVLSTFSAIFLYSASNIR